MPPTVAEASKTEMSDLKSRKVATESPEIPPPTMAIFMGVYPCLSSLLMVVSTLLSELEPLVAKSLKLGLKKARNSP
jgi:hypothetical protein